MAQLRPTPLLTPKHHLQRERGNVQETEEKNKDWMSYSFANDFWSVSVNLSSHSILTSELKKLTRGALWRLEREISFPTSRLNCHPGQARQQSTLEKAESYEISFIILEENKNVYWWKRWQWWIRKDEVFEDWMTWVNMRRTLLSYKSIGLAPIIQRNSE